MTVTACLDKADNSDKPLATFLETSRWVGATCTACAYGTATGSTTSKTFSKTLVTSSSFNTFPFSWQHENVHMRRPPLKERSPLYRRTGGHRPKQQTKPRRVIQRFNNEWQKGRYLEVENLGFVEACQQRGISVVKPQALFTSHLPEDPEALPEGFDEIEPTIKGEITNEVDHPNFHERPIRDYNPLHHSFPQRYELDCAKVLLKAVEVSAFNR